MSHQCCTIKLQHVQGVIQFSMPCCVSQSDNIYIYKTRWFMYISKYIRISPGCLIYVIIRIHLASKLYKATTLFIQWNIPRVSNHYIACGRKQNTKCTTPTITFLLTFQRIMYPKRIRTIPRPEEINFKWNQISTKEHSLWRQNSGVKTAI